MKTTDTYPNNTEKFTDNIRPRWWPRVPKEKIRRLYEDDAKGLVDDFLIEDVGLDLFRRCKSILIATEAHSGRAKCPRCGEIILHNWNKAETLTCSGCKWQTTWGAYFKTYQDKHLHGGGAMHAFQGYVDNYERTQTPRERFLLIDLLIHAFHNELTRNPGRPAGCNLIEGTLAEVVEFLDTLTYGEGSTSGTKEVYSTWLSKSETGDWFRSILNEVRNRRQHEGD